MGRFGERNVTVSEAFARPVLAGATMGALDAAGRSLGAPLGAATAPIFAPDVALPAQRPRRSAAELQPEKVLMLAMIQRMLDDIETYRPRVLRTDRDDPEAHRLFWGAVAYLRDPDTSWPFAFVPVCDALGFSADAIRRAVLVPGFRATRLKRQGGSRAQVVAPREVVA